MEEKKRENIFIQYKVIFILSSSKMYLYGKYWYQYSLNLTSLEEEIPFSWKRIIFFLQWFTRWPLRRSIPQGGEGSLAKLLALTHRETSREKSFGSLRKRGGNSPGTEREEEKLRDGNKFYFAKRNRTLINCWIYSLYTFFEICLFILKFFVNYLFKMYRFLFIKINYFRYIFYISKLNLGCVHIIALDLI